VSAIFALNVEQLADPDRFSRCLAAVPPERREKIARFRQEEDKRRSLGAGWLLEQVLRLYFGPDRPPIVCAPNGKPWIPDRPDWQFSLTHAGTWAVCGVDSQPLGVDAETVRRDGSKIAARCFAPDERAYLASLPEPQREQAFARLWTRKESYLKYTGEGLRRRLSSFSVLTDGEDAGGSPGPCCHRDLECWFTGYTLPDGTPVTLCTPHDLVPPEIGIWRLDD
jgi:4'-phosphopantetheinyl transferase